jgi:hypothetical protein
VITRRLFSAGLLAAPAIIRTPGLLMPVRPAPLRYNAEGLARILQAAFVPQQQLDWTRATRNEIFADLQAMFAGISPDEFKLVGLTVIPTPAPR